MAEYWNYVDALAYALALHNPEAREQFSGDTLDWHKAVYELKESLSDKLPEVFDHIFFDGGPGEPPYSPQVDHFLHVLAQARLMSAPNPDYNLFEMSVDQKEAITRLNSERLESEEKSLRLIGKQLGGLVRPSVTAGT